MTQFTYTLIKADLIKSCVKLLATYMQNSKAEGVIKTITNSSKVQLPSEKIPVALACHVMTMLSALLASSAL